MAEDVRTSLLDEIRADQGKPTQCGLCRWLVDRPQKEREEWEAAFVDRSFTHASIHRALQRRGANITRGSVENHRANGHKP